MSDDPPARLHRAAALHQAGRLSEAEPIYVALVADCPDFADALHLYGVLCAQSARNTQAIDLIGRAIAHNGHAAAYHANLARALRAEGRLAEAMDSLRHAITLHPTADALFSLGNLLRQTGQPAEAVVRYRDALALRPDFAEAHINVAMALETLGRREEALQHLRFALAAAPASSTALYNLARTEQARGALDHAAIGYRRTLRREPGAVEAVGNLGITLTGARQWAAAVTVLHRHVALAPDQPDRLLALATALAEAARSGHPSDSEALTAYRRLMRVTPDDPTAWQHTAGLHEAADRLDALAAVLTEVARLGRSGRFHWKTAYYHLVRLCNALLAQGRRDRVAALLPPVIAALRDVDAELHAWALFLQGSLAVLENRSSDARSLFTMALPHLPFLAHVALDDDFARRVDGLSLLVTEQSETAFQAQAFASPVTGTVVVAACDAGYLRRFGPLFLAVLDRVAPVGQAVHLHVVDPAPDTPSLIDTMSANLQRCTLGWSHEAAPLGLDAEGRRTYYSVARFLRLNRLVDRYRVPALVCDIDACVLNDPAAFIAHLDPDKPLALQHFPGNLAWLYDAIGGGLVVLRPEPAVLELFDRIRRFLLSWTTERRLSWFLDQIALVAGLDDAQRRGRAPGVAAIGTDGRLFRCGDGRFVQILGEKDRPGFADEVTALVRTLHRAGPPADQRFERERILGSLGISG